ncbi:Double-stranded RNA-specific editase 1 [Apostichopus japonicus]|uniref:Double-stranded RNA-specific editase 1 n=1 Tax=Stichopus japonicus TaxID=307972 RepID=A0A2G8LK90_STIJA|nr:Double-stranded RNA-specific editase 1 [Apostichopus japonicus]
MDTQINTQSDIKREIQLQAEVIHLDPAASNNKENEGTVGLLDGQNGQSEGGVKRPLEEGGESETQMTSDIPPKKRKKKQKKLHGPRMPKNALMQLNELRPGLEFVLCGQTGPVHAPVFHMSVEVNGKEFKGSGSTKKSAKSKAAEMALKSFIQFPNSSDAYFAMGKFVTADDFTADVSDPQTGFSPFEGNAGDKLASPENSTPTEELRKPQPQNQTQHKNPLMMLNEMRPGLHYKLESEEGQSHSKLFVMSVNVEGTDYKGQARNKKLAKARAAQAVLSAVTDASSSGAGRSLHGLIFNKFNELTAHGNSQYSRRKVLAGIVMTVNGDYSKSQVISVTTGTKCINGEYMSDQGLALNDCHAEILSRRCLMKFLYSQLKLHLGNRSDHSIFEQYEGGGGFRLKDGYSFHLYISTSPCGDARIFSPHEKGPAEDNKNGLGTSTLIVRPEDN